MPMQTRSLLTGKRCSSVRMAVSTLGCTPTRTATASGECSASEPQLACTVQVDAAAAGAEGPGGGGAFQYASDDGSRVYFTDKHRLTADATALDERPDLYEYDLQTGVLSDLTVTSKSTTADVLSVVGAGGDGSNVYFLAKGVLSEQANSLGAKAAGGKPNLYLRHAGATTFIATLNDIPGGTEGGEFAGVPGRSVFCVQLCEEADGL